MKRKTYIELAVVAEFMARQNVVVQDEYRALVGVLEDLGFLAYPQAEKVEPGLFAIRIRKGGNVRIFYIYDNGCRIYGIHAYTKKTRTIPDHELKQARKIARQLREAIS